MTMKVTEKARAFLKGLFIQRDWVNSDAPGSYGTNRGASAVIPNTSINWNTRKGDLLSCPAAQACHMFYWRNLPQATLRVLKKNGDEWEVDPNHPANALLLKPNAEYDFATLVNMAAYSLNDFGDAFLLMNNYSGGEPAELIWWPHERVDIPASNVNTIQEYILADNRGMRFMAPAEDVVHLRFGLDPADPRFGLSPLASAARDAATLQYAATYRANILRNSGVPGAVVSAKDPNIRLPVKELKDKFDSQSRGDMVGSTVVIDAPVDVNWPKVTPNDMALSTMEDRPESNICALFGIPILVIGLMGGADTKTYANFSEAREQAWEEGLMPLGSIIASQLTHRLMPLYKRVKGEYKFAFDYSEVRSLQPDLDALHQRARDDWNAGLLTLAEWKRAVGMKPEPGDETIRKMQPGAPTPETAPQNQEPAQPQKVEPWDLRILKELEYSRE